VICGYGWQDVKPIPDSTYNAVEAAYKKYITYLDSFEEDEAYLKKKVENELGGLFLQIKQRLAGLDPKWSKVSTCFRTLMKVLVVVANSFRRISFMQSSPSFIVWLQEHASLGSFQ